MNYCINCGVKLIQNSTYCQNCGTKIDEDNTIKLSNPTDIKDQKLKITQIIDENLGDTTWITYAIYLDIIIVSLWSMYNIIELIDFIQNGTFVISHFENLMNTTVKIVFCYSFLLISSAYIGHLLFKKANNIFELLLKYYIFKLVILIVMFYLYSKSIFSFFLIPFLLFDLFIMFILQEKLLD